MSKPNIFVSLKSKLDTISNELNLLCIVLSNFSFQYQKYMQIGKKLNFRE